MKGVLSAPAAPHRKMCTDAHTYTHTPQSTTLWRYLFNIGRIYSASLYVASNHADLQCQWSYSAENHAAKRIHAEMTRRRTEACMCNEKQKGQTAWKTRKHLSHPKIRYSLWAAQSHRNIDFTVSQIASYECSTSQLISSVSVQTTHTHTLRWNAHTQTHTPSPLGSCVGPKPRPRVLFHGSIITSISLHINLSTAHRLLPDQPCTTEARSEADTEK